MSGLQQVPESSRHPAGSAMRPTDQAAGLRSMLNRSMLRVLPVLGGGPKAGTSAIVSRLAHVASHAERVVVLDQTTGEIARQAGLPVRADLHDLLVGKLQFDQVAMRPGAWRLIPAQKGLSALLANGAAGGDFFRGFLQLHEPASLVLLNLADDEMALPDPGQHDPSEVLLITTPQSASMTAAYTRLKQLGRLNQAGQQCVVRVLVNGASSDQESQRVFRAIAQTAQQFLGMAPVFGGSLPPDASGRPYGQVVRPPDAACADALTRIASAMHHWRMAEVALHEQMTAASPLIQ